jgi:hypothetical protein
LRTFDFANPDTSSQGRFHTTVPQQALFLLNSPFVLEQARNLAHRPEVCRAAEPEDKIQALYEVALQRRARREELRAVDQFLTRQASLPDATVTPLEKFAQILLCSNELMFVN